MKRTIALILTAFALQAAADQKEPAYWMKAYPGTDNSKVQRCLSVAEEAYDKAAKGGIGLDGFAVLAKGTAWEKCMEGK